GRTARSASMAARRHSRPRSVARIGRRRWVTTVKKYVPPSTYHGGRGTWRFTNRGRVALLVGCVQAGAAGRRRTMRCKGWCGITGLRPVRHTLLFHPLREDLLELLDLRADEGAAIRLPRILGVVVLVIPLGRVERAERHDLRHHRL